MALLFFTLEFTGFPTKKSFPPIGKTKSFESSRSSSLSFDCKFRLPSLFFPLPSILPPAIVLTRVRGRFVSWARLNEMVTIPDIDSDASDAAEEADDDDE